MDSYIFIDIETVAQFPAFNSLSPTKKTLWMKKITGRRSSATSAPCLNNDYLYQDKAGIFAEFSQVICISIGHLHFNSGQFFFRLKSFAGRDEKKILSEFSKLCNENLSDLGRHQFVGHNIKEFDFPFLARRMIIQGIPLPKAFKIAGKKPWEIKHLVDTLELWKFGDYKNYISLNLLSEILNVPSPKDEMDGSAVHKVYWNERNLEKIRLYCEKDVFTTARVFFKLNQIELPQLLQVSSV